LASQAYSDYVNATVQLQTLDRQHDNLCQTKGNLNEHDGLTRKLRSELEGILQISTKEELHYKTMNFVIKKILRPNPMHIHQEIDCIPCLCK
jgi:hypothetical protein